MSYLEPNQDNLEKRNSRMLIIVSLVVFGMLGVSYLSVPLYRWFCQVTGWSGTPGIYSVDNHDALDSNAPIDSREFTVSFDANTSRDMPWGFTPQARSIENIHLGKQYLAFYDAYNPTEKTITGTATFNVTPLKFGQYFVKVDCFCFTEQTLKPGERVSMPVSFYIDPAIMEDSQLDDVKNVTLSYTFFPLEDDTQDKE